MKGIIGVDLGGTKLLACRVEGDRVAERCLRPVPVTDDEEVVLCELIDAVQTVFNSEVEAIGVGVPSVVDVDRGIVYTVQNIPSWKEVHLKRRLEETFRVPAYVNNDANCFVLGESRYGKGRGYRHIVGLTIGTGLGCGIIIDGRLYNGSNCGAGEIGTIPYKEQTIEYYCSGQYFSNMYGTGGEVFFERARAGDPDALQAYNRFGYEMGFAIMTALYAYDPEIIILGGSAAVAYPYFRKGMTERLESYAYQHALKRLAIEVAELPDVAILGAAALHLDAKGKPE